MLLVGIKAEQVNIKDGSTVSDFLKDRDDLPQHTRALTLKVDGVVLGPNAKVGKDAMVLEVIERHDPTVVADVEGDLPAPPLVAPEDGK